MSKTNRERLNGLYQKYNLTTEDLFKSPQGWTIITRGGIDKIQAQENIKIQYDLISSNIFKEGNGYEFNIIVKAIGTTEDGKYIETFGEATPKNTRNGYPVAIAEKRAMSRVVLKLAGFYELGVFGEDEWDDASKEANKHRQNIKSTL